MFQAQEFARRSDRTLAVVTSKPRLSPNSLLGTYLFRVRRLVFDKNGLLWQFVTMRGFGFSLSGWCLALAVSSLTLFPADPVRPKLAYSTHLGGQGPDTAVAIALDQAGNAYILGETASTNFPGAPLSGKAVSTFVTKLSPGGDRVLYTKLLPNCIGRSIAVDARGRAVISGETDYTEFPVTPNAFQKQLSGGRDALIVQLSADGSTIEYATFIGGTGDDDATHLALDSAGNFCAIGFTSSTNFPARGAAQTQLGGESDAFVLKLSAAGDQLLFSTFLGGNGADTGFGLVLSTADEIWVTGKTASPDFPIVQGLYPKFSGLGDAFVAKLSSTGTLLYSTYLGGDDIDFGSAIALDANGSIIVSGITSSTNFPTANPFQKEHGGDFDNFIARLSPDGSQLLFSSYLGGLFREGDFDNSAGPAIELAGLSVDKNGFIYLAGSTKSDIGFPTTNSFALRPPSYTDAAFLAKIRPDGTLVYNTLLGGSGDTYGHGVALDAEGGAYVVGVTGFAFYPPYFPTTPGALSTALAGPFTDGFEPFDAFISKIVPNPDSSFNDAFANRAAMSGTHWTALSWNLEATSEPGEPSHGGQPANHSVWWSWQAPSNGTATVNTVGSSFETRVAVYTGTNVSSLVALTNGLGANPGVSFPVQAGEQYAIAVDTLTNETGLVWLTLTLGVPPNDDVSNAIALSGSSAEIPGSNLDATLNPEEGNLPGSSGRSVWYRWVAPTNGTVAFEAQDQNFNAYLEAFVRPPGERLQVVAANLYSPRLVFDAVQGTEYFIMVDGLKGLSGSFKLVLEPAAAPSNNRFADRALLTGPLVVTNGSNVDATAEVSDPNLRAFGIYYPRGSTIWWQWSPPTNGAAIIQIESPGRTPYFAVFQGDSPTNLAPVAVADGVGVRNSRSQLLITNIVQDAHYQIVMDNEEWADPGPVTLKISLILPARFQKPVLTSEGIDLTAEGVLDAAYRLETSTNLTDWLPFATVPTTNGLIHARAPWQREKSRFYRAVELKPPAN